jgi:hypothetical protein
MPYRPPFPLTRHVWSSNGNEFAGACLRHRLRCTAVHRGLIEAVKANRIDAAADR